jgi:hypothetical protein
MFELALAMREQLPALTGVCHVEDVDYANRQVALVVTPPPSVATRACPPS